MGSPVGRRAVLTTGGLVVAGVAGCLRLQGGSTGGDGSTADRTGGTGPTAAFEYSPEKPHVGERVTFDASPSTAPAGEIVDYSWGLIGESGDGPRLLGTGRQLTHRFGAGGDYDVGLQVFDDRGNGDRTIQTVTVSGDVSEVGDTLTFDWGQVFVPAEEGGQHPNDDRSLAFACRTLSVLANGAALATFDIGGNPEPLFAAGVYSPESSDRGTFRWFGGPDRRSTLAFPDTDLDEATTIRLEGHLPPMERQDVTVSINGTETDSREFTDQVHVVDLSATP